MFTLELDYDSFALTNPSLGEVKKFNLIQTLILLFKYYKFFVHYLTHLRVAIMKIHTHVTQLGIRPCCLSWARVWFRDWMAPQNYICKNSSDSIASLLDKADK